MAFLSHQTFRGSKHLQRKNDGCKGNDEIMKWCPWRTRWILILGELWLYFTNLHLPQSIAHFARNSLASLPFRVNALNGFTFQMDGFNVTLQKKKKLSKYREIARCEVKCILPYPFLNSSRCLTKSPVQRARSKEWVWDKARKYSFGISGRYDLITKWTIWLGCQPT